jgi:hypothetical protein
MIQHQGHAIRPQEGCVQLNGMRLTSAMLTAITVIATPLRATAVDLPKTSPFRDLYRQCVQADACLRADGGRRQCSAGASACMTYVSILGAPLQLGCYAARQGRTVPRFLASDPADNARRVHAVVSYGLAHPETMGESRDVNAMVAITSLVPCTGVRPGVLVDP